MKHTTEALAYANQRAQGLLKEMNDADNPLRALMLLRDELLEAYRLGYEHRERDRSAEQSDRDKELSNRLAGIFVDLLKQKEE